MGRERRRFPRIRTDFGVEYKLKGSDAPPVKAVSVNISEGGVMMKISEKLAPETQIELKLTLQPPFGTIKTSARIVYILENYWEEYPPYRCGVEFLGLNKEDQQKIKEFVAKEVIKMDWTHWL